jgi:hypothetical protein
VTAWWGSPLFDSLAVAAAFNSSDEEACDRALAMQGIRGLAKTVTKTPQARGAERRQAHTHYSRATCCGVTAATRSGRGARHERSGCPNRPLAGALAFRRSTAAFLARLWAAHDSVQAARHANQRSGRYPIIVRA